MRAILTLDPNHNMKLWMEVSVLAPSMDELGTVVVCVCVCGGGGYAGGSCMLGIYGWDPCFRRNLTPRHTPTQTHTLKRPLVAMCFD